MLPASVVVVPWLTWNFIVLQKMKPTFALCNSALHYLFACDYANFLSSKFQCSESVFMRSPLMDRYPEQHNGKKFMVYGKTYRVQTVRTKKRSQNEIWRWLGELWIALSPSLSWPFTSVEMLPLAVPAGGRIEILPSKMKPTFALCLCLIRMPLDANAASRV